MLTLIRYSGLDNEASTSDPAADVSCPQSILGKRGCDIQCKAVRSRVTSEVEGAEKQSWPWASTLDACSLTLSMQSDRSKDTPSHRD